MVSGGRIHGYQLGRRQTMVIELEHFSDNGAIFLPGASTTPMRNGACRVSGIEALREVLKHARVARHVLVAGHHEELSTERARGVHFLLIGNRFAWASLSESVATPGDKEHVCSYWGDSLPPSAANWTIETWGSVFDLYRRALADGAPAEFVKHPYIVARYPRNFIPSIVARDATGDEERYVEMNALNPSKPKKGDRGWNPTWPDETVLLPDDWDVYVDKLVAAGWEAHHGERGAPSEPDPIPPSVRVESRGCGARHLATPFDGNDERRAQRRHVEVLFGDDSLSACAVDGDCTTSSCTAYDPMARDPVFWIPEGQMRTDIVVHARCADTNRDLDACAVRLEGPSRRDVVTDDAGTARFDRARTGSYQVVGARRGYRSETLDLVASAGPFELDATAAQVGAAPFGAVGNYVFMQLRPKRIVVTQNEACRRIMRHEFNRPTGGAATDPDAFEFDPAPLEQFIASLSAAQRELLTTYAIERPPSDASRSKRLVIIVGKDPSVELIHIGIDNTRGAIVHPTATFSVFLVSADDSDVELVCHTRCLRVDAFAPVFQRRSNPKPPRHLIATVLPSIDNERETVGVLWHRIFRPNGTDIMPTNFLHGMINAHGCWTLFRNYNWPISHYEAFEDIYIKHFHVGRDAFKTDTTQAALNGVVPGYDIWKYSSFDQNSAYNRFFEHVVGIRPFARKWWVNDFGVTGRVLQKEVPAEHVADKAALNMYSAITRQEDDIKSKKAEAVELRKKAAEWDEILKHLGPDLPPWMREHKRKQIADMRAKALELDHEADAIKNRTAEFRPTNALFGPNALGFQASRGFVPFAGSVGSIEELSWADVYFYDHS
jgi:hypothetical protein